MPSWPTFERVVGSGRRERAADGRGGAAEAAEREGFRLEVTRAGKHYYWREPETGRLLSPPTRLSCCGIRKCECSGRQDGNP